SNAVGSLKPNSSSQIPGSVLPSLPPANPGSSGAGLGTGVTVPKFTPQAASPDQAKDSLVVQFDLADNSTPSGAELEKEGKYPEALQAYRSVLQQNPQDAASWWAMGNLYRKLNQKTYAIQCFEQVLKLQPNNSKLADWLQQYKASNP
ncbi:MAG TPA: tetratricopeptide repeat protein, partial [bacterium]|nr:tetratricopeptide repeat protein [bacterium]